MLAAARRWYSDSDKPRNSASREMQVGGSWQWSPTRTNCLAPRSTTGTIVEISVACATSSISAARNWKSRMIVPPALMVVMQITSASFKISVRNFMSSARCFLLFTGLPISPVLFLLPVARSAMPPSAPEATAALSATLPVRPASSAPLCTSLPSPSFRDLSTAASLAALRSSCFFAVSIESSVISSRCSRHLSGLPTRTARMPARRRPSAMLSTAMLLSEVARIGERPKTLTQLCKTLTDTCVLPVPGGPCTIVQRRIIDSATAERCEAFRFSMEPTTSAALALRSAAASALQLFGSLLAISAQRFDCD
mmetsp:Transcript_90588/g.265129  ORF Transcript_90588/g.265129 Transcript_90588/m.265129 type:complete len:310 (+) Transcript_90588:1934-2863(+)